MSTRGTFITLEGGEGAGKTTQQKRLAAALEAAGKKVVLTREPGGSAGAEVIRDLLVKGETNRWDALTEAMLLFAARRDHVHKVIEPALSAGAWVISDRFYDSTYAYQGYGLGLDMKVIDKLRELAIGSFAPDITFILDIPVDVGLARVAAEQRYERMGRDFHERMRAGFLEIAKKETARVKVVDACQDIDAMTKVILAHMPL